MAVENYMILIELLDLISGLLYIVFFTFFFTSYMFNSYLLLFITSIIAYLQYLVKDHIKYIKEEKLDWLDKDVFIDT
jgi:hypothetical protein